MHIHTGIVTLDSELAVKIRQDLAQFGFTAMGENNGDGKADVLLLDCRASTKPLQDYEALRHDKIVIAIVDARADLPIDTLSDATDILFYPYSKEELFVRIMLATQRNQQGQIDNIFRRGSFRIDFTNYEVSIDGIRLDLTYKEYELLKHLASAPGRVFTRSQLLKSVWGYDYIEGARTVDVHIRRLRSKLGTKYAPLVETVRHVGYRFRRTPF